MSLHYHYIEDILKSWTFLKFAPDRLKQEISENIQQFATCSDLTFSPEELKIIQESKDFLCEKD